MKKPLPLIAAVPLALVLAGCASEPATPELGDLVIVWQDEFDGAADASPSAARWTFDVGGGGWGNDQLEYDTARPENVSLDGDGHLRIVAREEAYLGNDYTSARIKTQGRFSQTYGRFEARIKLPIGQGMWPAFWLLGDNIGTVGWPACGEVDIMEYRGQAPNVANFAMHGPGYSGGQALHGSYVKGGAGFDADFHVFAVEWGPTYLAWSVDGVERMRKTVTDLPSGTTWVFNHPFFIILNLAVGGNYVGPPDAGTEFPQTMLVDWVRVYGTP